MALSLNAPGLDHSSFMAQTNAKLDALSQEIGIRAAQDRVVADFVRDNNLTGPNAAALTVSPKGLQVADDGLPTASQVAAPSVVAGINGPTTEVGGTV